MIESQQDLRNELIAGKKIWGERVTATVSPEDKELLIYHIWRVGLILGQLIIKNGTGSYDR